VNTGNQTNKLRPQGLLIALLHAWEDIVNNLQHAYLITYYNTNGGTQTGSYLLNWYNQRVLVALNF
jgi:hypothetical protein